MLLRGTRVIKVIALAADTILEASALLMILVSVRQGRAPEEDTRFLIKAQEREAFAGNCYSQF
jgi:hypothetical protein